MGLYSGFDVAAMLNFISEQADEVKLEMVEHRKWRLYVMSRKYGEFESIGTLFFVVMNAFKPYLADAKKARIHVQMVFESVLNKE